MFAPEWRRNLEQLLASFDEHVAAADVLIAPGLGTNQYA